MDSFPSTLTPLQREILAALREGPPFFLTGGAALASGYLRHRQSLDLDLFVVEAGELDRLGALLERVAAQQGWALETLRRYPGFRRYRVQRDEAATLLDLVHETAAQVVPLLAKPVHDGVRFDAIEDLVANKLCAVLGRSEVKDLVDLYFLADSGIDVLAHLDQANQKNAGLDPATLAYVLREMSTDPEGLLLLRPVAAGELALFRDRLVDRLVQLAWPQHGG
ncbi:MAG: nucleotidyl transferase AbiEii/AbiGii toxin family protein [Myxococcota bacterium]|jgi:predicted nucleotidyltransferase component of viral defense system|nr:nucleotidyl transferase AbiEii/AbiGii toxin family protein [Myxococcota bacterium]